MQMKSHINVLAEAFGKHSGEYYSCTKQLKAVGISQHGLHTVLTDPCYRLLHLTQCLIFICVDAGDYTAYFERFSFTVVQCVTTTSYVTRNKEYVFIGRVPLAHKT